jgi:prolipoprotein diacylglyceryl transferase
MVLASIPSPPSNAVDIGPLTVHYYGVAIAVGVLVAVTLLRRRYTAAGGDPELADRTALWAVAMGLVGARMAYVSTHLGRFSDEPWKVIAVWEGGLAFFGGLVLGALAAIWYLRRQGGDLPAFADGVAPAIPLAQAIGRIGNYFNQELYGTPTDLPWGVEIDPSNRVPQYQEYATFHPTFLYEAIWNVGLAAFIIWLGRRGTLRRGALIFVYAAGYGFMRFLLELIRTDTAFRLFGISRNGYVALLAFTVGLVGLWVYHRRGTVAAAAHDAEDETVPASDVPVETHTEAEEPHDRR